MLYSGSFVLEIMYIESILKRDKSLFLNNLCLYIRKL